MKIEVYYRFGSPPLMVDADQVVIRANNGSVISAAATYGDGASVLHTRRDDPDFQQRLNELGIRDPDGVDSQQAG